MAVLARHSFGGGTLGGNVTFEGMMEKEVTEDKGPTKIR